MDGCSIVRVPANIPTYAIGRSGQTTGLNRVDMLDSTGLIASGFDELAGLSPVDGSSSSKQTQLTYGLPQHSIVTPTWLHQYSREKSY